MFHPLNGLILNAAIFQCKVKKYINVVGFPASIFIRSIILSISTTVHGIIHVFIYIYDLTFSTEERRSCVRQHKLKHFLILGWMNPLSFMATIRWKLSLRNSQAFKTLIVYSWFLGNCPIELWMLISMNWWKLQLESSFSKLKMPSRELESLVWGQDQHISPRISVLKVQISSFVFFPLVCMLKISQNPAASLVRMRNDPLCPNWIFSFHPLFSHCDASVFLSRSLHNLSRSEHHHERGSSLCRTIWPSCNVSERLAGRGGSAVCTALIRDRWAPECPLPSVRS